MITLKESRSVQIETPRNPASSEVLGLQTMAPIIRAARIPLVVLTLAAATGLLASKMNPDAQSSNASEAKAVLRNGPQRTPMYTDIRLTPPEPYSGTVSPQDRDPWEGNSFTGRYSQPAPNR